ncbi:MAG: Ig-like domain-containing protein [Candidatus Kapabacteria bacterium]|nr:Ig-like domain-containing protein [Candidatus Kapabacteria bacterium]
MKLLIVIIIVLINAFLTSIKIFSVDKPNLPNTSDVISCFPDTSNYKKISVGPVGRDFTDLQAAINSASHGTIIRIDAGITLSGGFILPRKASSTEWIILTSSRMDLLPKDEERINPSAATGDIDFPTQASAMPKIITTNLSGIPCFVTQANSHHYRLVGLEITAASNVVNSYGLVNLGDGSSAQSSLSQVPDHFVIDRCFIHGHTNATIMKYGIALNCANAAIIDSYISDFHSVGYDAQAISGINGPGPFKIINNYLEASGENIMFGGAAASIQGLVPSDIEVRNNYLYKPYSWRLGHPLYAGKHWTIKNLFELKTGMRVLLDGNILENSWADLPIGQSGYAILLTIRTEAGGSPQAEVSDITISNNVIRHAGAGITLSGRDDGSTGQRSKRISIYNNLFEDINGPLHGDMNINGPNDGTFIKIGEPEDVVIDHNTIFQTGSITWAIYPMNGFVFTNNICNSFISAAGYQGIYGPGYQQGNSTISHFFPDVTDANQHIHKNVLISGDVVKYTNFNTISKDYFPKTVTDVGFVNYSSGTFDYHNYTLLSSSQFYKNSIDSKSIGIDIILLDSAMKTDRGCPKNSEIKVTSVSLVNKSIKLIIQDNWQLVAIISPGNAKNKNLTWSSSDDKIAIVSSNGFVLAKSKGSALIFVKTEDGGFTDTCTVLVENQSGVIEPSKSELFNLSPNPANDEIFIRLSNNDPFHIEVSNLLGIVVVKADNKTLINISHLQSGIYFIKLYQGIETSIKVFTKL